jgi:hypothetical protein
MRIRISLCLMALLAAGCQTSREVKTLAARTAPFVVGTHASVPAVERAFAAQSSRTMEEISRYNDRKRAAQSRSEPVALLWSLSKTATDKRSTELLQRIRADDAAMLAPPAATPAAGAATAAAPAQRPGAGIGEIVKVTSLLRDIHEGKFGGFNAAATFGQETWKQLKQLEKDAESDAAAAPAAPTP